MSQQYARQVLNLAHCHMLSTLVGVVETMPNLRDVELTDTGIGDADLRLLASNCHHIQCAAVARCPVDVLLLSARSICRCPPSQWSAPLTRIYPGSLLSIHLTVFSQCRKLGLSGCMRIEGPGLGLHGLAGGMAVEEGRLRVLGLRGLNVASRSSQRGRPGSQLLDNALGELLAALAAARCICYRGHRNPPPCNARE